MNKQIAAVVAAHSNLTRAETALQESTLWARRRALNRAGSSSVMAAELTAQENEELDALLQALRTAHAEWTAAFYALRCAAQKSADLRRSLLVENPPR